MHKWLGLLMILGVSACDVEDECSEAGVCGVLGAENEAPPTRETFENYGTNPFVDPTVDSQITFGVDIDTGSYTLGRDSIEGGALPPVDSVRVEEYVNFFDYQDAPPESRETPFAVHTQVAPSPFGAGLHLLRVALKGYEVVDAERPAANLVFLVDSSGSMQSDDKIGLVRYALRRLTQRLLPTDTVAIVTYAGDAAVRLEPTPVADAPTILTAVDELTAFGSTHGSAGIETAYALAESAFRADGINRVILCSDGDFNVGVTGDALHRLIEQKREAGVTLSVFGFGRGNYNDRDMEQLADLGNGNYAYIDKQAEAERVLVRNITGTLFTIAKDVKIQVDVNADLIERYRLIGYENRDIADNDFRNDAVDAGEIGAGHTVTAFIEIELAEGYANGELATVKVRWKDPMNNDATSELAHPVEGALVREVFDEAGRALRFGAAVVEFAEILRGSQHSTGRDFAGIVRIAREAAAPSDRDQAEFIELVEQARRLPAR